MSKKRQLFGLQCAEVTNTSEYMGSDGVPTIKTYNFYLNKCEEFKKKAKKYEKDNLYLKNSILHHLKIGYESTNQLEEEILLEREEHMTHYKKVFQITLFEENLNFTYECSTGKSKRIRIIRELQDARNEEFSDEFEHKQATWFTRYCILSKFIQSARKIILLNRLQKVLAVLKTLTPEIIRIIEDEIVGKENPDIVNENFQPNK